jgi:hypothetical protein
VGEANRQLALVRPLVSRIVEMSEQLPETQDGLRIAEYRMRRLGAVEADRRRFEQAREAASTAERELAGALSELDHLGVVLKDARTGLVDFYSYRDGELVELCWRLGEDRVAHWHKIGDGFSGRRPL